MLPEERRAEVKRRFAAGRERLLASGLLETLAAPDGVPREQLRPLGLAYFRLGIACPFLEEESCSIYSERPIACREYMVTSPAENCASPSAERVEVVPLAARVSAALLRAERRGGDSSGRWLPLILAPEWAEAHPDLPRPRPGPDILRDVFEELTGDKVPAPEGAGKEPK